MASKFEVGSIDDCNYVEGMEDYLHSMHVPSIKHPLASLYPPKNSKNMVGPIYLLTQRKQNMFLVNE